MYTLTVFTSTYNRAEYLKKCYQSLIAQTNLDFIWQVIDDGSSDGTKELIESFIQEKKIAIDYHWKKNGGKASSINYSLDITQTPLWMSLDSDDYLFEKAVDVILTASKDIMNNEAVSGIFAVRSDPSGKPMKAVDVPPCVAYATQLDIRYKYNVAPEYVQVYKTQVINKYRFPICDGERFVTESWMQDQIDQEYVFKIIHEPLMVCEYLPDGLTNSYYRLIRNNPRGFLAFYAQRVKLCKIIKQKMIAGIMYNAVYSLINDRTIKREKGFIICFTSMMGKLMLNKIKNK